MKTARKYMWYAGHLSSRPRPSHANIVHDDYFFTDPTRFSYARPRVHGGTAEIGCGYANPAYHGKTFYRVAYPKKFSMA